MNIHKTSVLQNNILKEFDHNFPENLLRNDQDSTKHMCLFYLAGIIGTGVELEDYFYLLCKTLAYDKIKVKFFYSAYMTITQHRLFENMPAILTDSIYEQWVTERKRHCTSTRTSTCENLCKRQAYRSFNIPLYACQFCKLSASYQNSRDPLERLMIRYYMDASTPASRIFSSGLANNFVSVERISPQLSSFGKFPVIRIYDYIYDFLLNHPSALSLRGDKEKFNAAVTLYICDHIDLSVFSENTAVTTVMLKSRLLDALWSLWDTDISILQSKEDGSRLVDMCIRSLNQPYNPIYEGKQANPSVIVRSNSGARTDNRSNKNHAGDHPSYQQNLFELAAEYSSIANFIEEKPSVICATEGQTNNSCATPADFNESFVNDSEAAKTDNLENTSDFCFVDCTDFSDTDYAPFLQETNAIVSDDLMNDIDTFHADDNEIHPCTAPVTALTSVMERMSYLGQLFPNASLAYQYCIIVPSNCFHEHSESAIVRVTENNITEFVHTCVSSASVILHPAIVGSLDEGLLVYTANNQPIYFYNFIARGTAELDMILDGCNHIYSADTMGCMNMLSKYGSTLMHDSIISMDLYFMLLLDISNRSQLYAHDWFSGGKKNPYNMALSVYLKFRDANSKSGNVKFSDIQSCISRLQCAYRVLFRQIYMSPIIAEGKSLLSFSDDLVPKFLFQNGYRFSRSGTIYTILFRSEVCIAGDLSENSILPDILAFLEHMPRRYYDQSRLVHCDKRSITLFIGSIGSDAELFYDMLYQSLERCLSMYGYRFMDTVTVRVEYI